MAFLTLFSALLASGSLVAQDKREIELSIKQISGREAKPTTTTTKLKLVAWTKPGKKGSQRILYTIESPEAQSEVRLPLGSLEVDSKGRVQLKLAHPMDFVLTGALRRAFGIRESVPTKRLTDLAAGEERIRIPGLRTNARVPVTYEVTESTANPEHLAYKVEMVGDTVTSSFGRAKVEISSVGHDLVFDKETQRLVSATWSRQAVRRAGSISTRMDEVIEYKEVAYEKLSSADYKAVVSEYDDLEPVAIGSLPGEANEKLRKLADVLDKYTKKHESGALAHVVPALTAALDKRLAQIGAPRDPDVLGQRMVGKKAPDFKLKDLAGREVSLADFAGKIVLITFWGYA